MSGKIKESHLLKALNELEEIVEKGGDPLQNQDPEGGLSTEGKPLSDQAKGGAPVLKAGKRKRTRGGEGASSSSSSSVSKADAASSSTSKSTRKAEAESSSVSKSKTCKAVPPKDKDEDKKPGEEESSSASSPDEPTPEEASKCGKARKSLRAEADENETLRKGIEVSDFLEAMIDQTSSALDNLRESLGESIAKSESVQSNFNTRLAKAVVQIGNTVNDLSEVVKTFAGQPHVPQRRSVINKSEVPMPPLGGGEGGDLAGMPRAAIQDWLEKSAMKGEIDPITVTVFEQNGYDPRVLPPHIQKALINDLQK